jgi:CRP-like cAMP-binding protein
MDNFTGRQDDARKGVRNGGGVHAAHGARRAPESVPDGRLQPKSLSGLPLNGLLANNLLASLPAEDFARILPHLDPVTLAAGNDLYQFEQGIRFAYFPENTVISNLYVLADGNTTEAALIGSEGIVGLSAVFNASQPNYWTRVLIAGSALRIKMEVIRQEFSAGGALQRALLLYASARLSQLSQRAVCNGTHRVEERLCSWLLMVHDRAGDDQLQLTHEQIASHLGTRRAGITEATNSLRDRGGISYNRGLIRILDRQALEAAACECYPALNQMVAGAGRQRRG